MHSQALAATVESFHRHWRAENPLFFQVSSGQFNNDKAGKYLKSILYIITHTPIHLKKAAQVAAERNLPELEAFFKEKLHEEDGHDAWAKDDLKAGGHDYSTGEVTQTIQQLVAYLDHLIEHDPTHYIAYILFAEYFTVLAGPELVELLVERCGLKRSQFSVIDNHAELDKAHIQHDFHCIDEVIPQHYQTQDLLTILERSCAFYDEFCREVVAS